MQGRVRPERHGAYQIFPSSAWREELHEIRALGFDFVELLYDRELACRAMTSGLEVPRSAQHFPRSTSATGGRRYKSTSDSEVRRYKSTSDSEGRRYKSTSDSEGRRYKDTSPGAESVCGDYLTTVSALRSPGVFRAALCDAIDWTSALGARLLVVPFFGCNGVESAKQFRMAMKVLTDCGVLARLARTGCTLAVEADLPADDLIETLRQSESPAEPSRVGICYDVGNARAGGRLPQEELLALRERVVHIHIKDRTVGGPNVPLGAGDVDFEACFRSLDRIGYSGLVTLETHYGESPPDEAARNLRFVRDVQERTQSCVCSS